LKGELTKADFRENDRKVRSLYKKYDLSKYEIYFLDEIKEYPSDFRMYPYLKNSISAEDLIQKVDYREKLQIVREHFIIIARQHKVATSLDEKDLIHSDPNLGNKLIYDGKYLWIDFDTSFSDKSSIQDRVIFSLRGTILNISQFFNNKQLEGYLQEVIKAYNNDFVLRRVVDSVLLNSNLDDFLLNYNQSRKDKHMHFQVFTVENYLRVFRKLDELMRKRP
jgi:hypothetical protein